MRNSLTDIRPIAGALGAELHGIDLRDISDEAQFRVIREALVRYGVIFMPEQSITPEQQIAFARRFGPIDVNRFFTPVPGHAEIAEVRKEPDQTRNIGEVWHTDHSYDAAPALCSILLAREVPEFGGDTMFANLALAYDSLSDGLKRTLERLRAIHSSRHVFGANASYHSNDLKDRLANPELATQDAVHPVVIRHPESGRKVLYVNPNFTVGFEGWSIEESRSLLGYLYQHAIRPEFTCRYRWQRGTIAVWDNRSTWHYAINDYPGQRRLMHRITVEGEPLPAA